VDKVNFVKRNDLTSLKKFTHACDFVAEATNVLKGRAS
jgi:hypothetical protein